MKWILLTAGLSPSEMRQAAERVSKAGVNLYPFSKVVNLNQDNFSEICPRISSSHPEIFTADTKGFGYYSWKVEMVYAALNGDYGPCDGAVWIDAGCEIFPTLLNKIIFRVNLYTARRRGYRFFKLNTPEHLYSKESCIKSFNDIQLDDKSDQFQGTYFILSGEVGKTVANLAFFTMLNDISIMDPDALSPADLQKGVAHKSDQSIFSLSLKSLKLTRAARTPPAGNRGKISAVKAFFSPIWVSRNRSGESIIPKWLERWI